MINLEKPTRLGEAVKDLTINFRKNFVGAVKLVNEGRDERGENQLYTDKLSDEQIVRMFDAIKNGAVDNLTYYFRAKYNRAIEDYQKKELIIELDKILRAIDDETVSYSDFIRICECCKAFPSIGMVAGNKDLDEHKKYAEWYVPGVSSGSLFDIGRMLKRAIYLYADTFRSRYTNEIVAKGISEWIGVSRYDGVYSEKSYSYALEYMTVRDVERLFAKYGFKLMCNRNGSWYRTSDSYYKNRPMIDER